jgi:hypothetical protein
MYTLTGCDTAGAGQHRLIRSAPSRPVDVAVAQNDLPPPCATGPGPITHPASRSMTSPPLSVTVMIRPAADETTTRDGRPLAQAGTSYASQMDRLRMRGEQLAVAAPARPSFRVRWRDALTTTATAAVAAGRCWSCLSLRADSLHGQSPTGMWDLMHAVMWDSRVESSRAHTTCRTLRRVALWAT